MVRNLKVEVWISNVRTVLEGKFLETLLKKLTLCPRYDNKNRLIEFTHNIAEPLQLFTKISVFTFFMARM